MENIILELKEHINYLILTIVFIVLTFLKDWLVKLFKIFKEKFELNIEKITEKNNLIYDLLSEIRAKTDSARTYIIEFHNGEYYSNGVPIVKFSMTYESCSLGVSSHSDTTQNYILSNYDGIENLIKNTDEIIHINNLKSSNFKGYLQEKNTLAIYSMPIRSHKNYGNVIGCFCIEWCSSSKVDNINKENVYNIKEKYLPIIQNLVNKQR